MSSSWDTTKAILYEAMQLPAEERAAYLDEVCGEDPALRKEIEELLAAHDEAPSFLGAEETMLAAEAVPTERVGDTVGRYKLLQQIGEGGFGSVYLAEQTEPVQRRVALKIIKLGMDTRQVIARFEAERQALAMMDHPGIARVFDAGATETGRPYFVMELVKGLPITEYCDQRRLTVSERLELFVQVCRAVQHAHQKGIVHRDIKPTNVLVTRVNDAPVVKVIDFGIAKATDQRLTERTVFTRMGQLIGTPAYMSPEQADPIGEDVDTRSDVYSMGVLLYELVTGTTPFAIEPLRGAGFDEIRRVIREVDPPTASTRVSGIGDEFNEMASQRGTDPRRLRTLVQGDLDAILLMALEKDRSRRYQTPIDFSRDIEAFLGDEPVQARFPSAGYRLRKFARRNRGPVLAGALVLAALVLGLFGTTLFAIRAGRAERQAVVEAEAAERVSDFLEGLFKSNDPGSVREQELTAREILDAGAERVEAELADDPLMRARLETVIGRVYANQGRYDEAKAILNRARETYDAHAQSSVRERVQCLDALATVHRDQGVYDEAEKLSQRARDLFRGDADLDDADKASVLLTYGLIRHGQGDYAGAEAVQREALALLESAGRGETATAASCLINIANNRWMVEDVAQADSLYGLAQAIEEKVHGADHFRVATILHNRALIAIAAGRLEDARRLEERALSIRDRVLGDHWHTALSLSTLGYVRYVTGEVEEARPLVERALAIDTEQFQPIKYETGFDCEVLSRIYVDLGLLDEAEQLLDRADPIWEALGLPYGGHRGWLLMARGNLDEAEAYFRRTIAQDGGDWFQTTVFDCRAGLAEVARRRGDAAAEKAELEQAIAVGVQAWPGGHPRMPGLKERLASL